MKKQTLKKRIGPEASSTAADFLAAETGLSKARIKDAMEKGAAWLTRGTEGRRRIRKGKAVLRPADLVELCYDEDILSRTPPEARCLYDEREYSVWYKPAGLMAQGTNFGDHCSLLRQAETAMRPRPVFLIHRLDREASGLMLLGHGRKAAAALSALFRDQTVRKTYRTEVLGVLSFPGDEGTISLPLDGKEARTEYRVLCHDPERGTTLLEVEIRSGRLHQIRRHLAMIGFPVMGDPRYGEGNKDSRGLQLVAVELSFRCPVRGQEVACRLPETDI